MAVQLDQSEVYSQHFVYVPQQELVLRCEHEEASFCSCFEQQRLSACTGSAVRSGTGSLGSVSVTAVASDVCVCVRTLMQLQTRVFGQ